MVLVFTVTQKGKQMLKEGGFLFTKEKFLEERNLTVWKCDNYKKAKCPARRHTNEVMIVKVMGQHNHVPDAAASAAKDVLADIKLRAVQTRVASVVVVAEGTEGLMHGVQGKLPSVESMKRTVRRQRQQNGKYPHNPMSLRDLVIPPEFSTILNENQEAEQFLQFDSGAGEDRILLFTTKRNLELLSRCQHWYADGTFKTAPPLFSQLYTIHGVQFHNVIPSIFALLSNKSELTYTRLLDALKNLEPFVNPTTIMTDFEVAAINLFRMSFPAANLRGFLFHMSQCLWRRVQADGLAGRCADDVDFALQIRLLTVLAFVPIPDVVHVYNELIQSPYYVQEAVSLQSVVDYFDVVWIGRLTVNGRRAPTFAHHLWNCFDAVVEDLPRTNNAVEGWHRRFNEFVGAQHPSIWKFIDSLKKEQKSNELSIEQFIQGRNPPVGRRVYRDVTTRIRNAVNGYGMINNIDYLRGIAHNLNLNV